MRILMRFYFKTLSSKIKYLHSFKKLFFYNNIQECVIYVFLEFLNFLPITLLNK